MTTFTYSRIMLFESDFGNIEIKVHAKVILTMKKK